jgi:hypothetical protein
MKKITWTVAVLTGLILSSCSTSTAQKRELTKAEREACHCDSCPRCPLGDDGKIANRCERRDLPCVVPFEDQSGRVGCKVLEGPGSLLIQSPNGSVSHMDFACP